MIIGIFTLISMTIYGQENYKPGYIITNSMDTIRGYILSVNNKPYKECCFKKDIKDKPQIYLPDQIFAYRFDGNGKFFISKDTPDQNGTTKYFLEFMIQGKANIYMMTDVKDHFYIETDKYKMMELSEPLKYSKNEYGVLLSRPNKYTGKLKYVMSDCPEVFSEIDDLKLYPKAIIKLAENYHNHVCSGDKCIIYEKKIAPLKIDWGPVAGISYNSFYFNGQNYSNYQSNNLLGINIELDNLIFAKEQIFLKTGVYLQQFNNYNLYEKRLSIDGVDYYGNFLTGPINFKSYVLLNPITFNYSFPMNKFAPYVGAGISNMFILTQNKDYHLIDFKYYNGLEEYKSYLGNVLPFYHLGFMGAVGLKYKFRNNHSINLEFNYQNFNNLNANLSLRINTIYYSAQLGYLF